MPTLQSEHKRVLQNLSVVYLGIGIVAIILCWVPWLAAAFGNSDIFQRSQAPTDFMRTVYLWVGLVASVAAIPITLLARGRAAALAERGVSVEGRPVKLGGAVADGMRSVTFAYVVRGQELTVTIRVLETVARKYTRSTRVTIVYDPETPTSCHVLDANRDDDGPATFGEAVKEGLREGVYDAVDYGVMVITLTVSALVFFGLWRLFAGEMPNSMYGTSLMCAACAVTGGVRLALDWRAVRKQEDGVSQSFRWHIAIIGITLAAGIGMFTWTWSEESAHRTFLESQAIEDQQMRDMRHKAETAVGLRPAPQAAVAQAQPSGFTNFGEFKGIGDLAGGQSISVFANGKGTLKFAMPDPANPGKSVLGEEDGLWVRSGDQLTFTMAATAMTRGIPPKLRIQKFTIASDGKTLRRADGLELQKQP